MTISDLSFSPMLITLAQEASGTTGAPASAPQSVGVPVAPGAAPIVPGAAPGGGPPAGNSMIIFWLLPVMLLVMIVMSSLTGRKERKRRAELLASMKKYDKVVTSGGIIGEIVDLTETEAVLRIEDGRIRVAKSAIQTVMADSRGLEADKAEAKPA